MDEGDLIDRIYECAVLPELWPDVLDRLSKLAGARGGLMFGNYATAAFVWTASSSIRHDYARYFSDRVHALSSERVPRLLGARHAGFMREHDVYTDQELARDTMYRDFLRPIGLGWATGTAIDTPTGNVIVLSLERERALGPVEDEVVRQLDALRPHLARAAFLSTRLALARARAAADALAATGLPAVVFDPVGKVIVANDLVEQLSDQIHWRPGNKIALKDRGADKLLQEALATLAVATGPVRSFVARTAEGEPRTVAHLIPLKRSARDLAASCAAILVLTPGGDGDLGSRGTHPVLVRPDARRGARGARHRCRRQRRRHLRALAPCPARPSARICARCSRRPGANARPRSPCCWAGSVRNGRGLSDEYSHERCLKDAASARSIR